MKYKAIIFDLDGTIVDTTDIWSEANRILIERRGIPFSHELQAELKPRIHGLSTRKSVSIIKDLTKIDGSIEQLVDEKLIIAVNLYRQSVKFITGFKEFHDALAVHDLKKAVATNADDITIKTTDEVLGLAQYFGPHIYGISAVDYVYKPHPAIYLHAAEQIEVDPQECIAIEDSAFGIAAAQSAGIFCVGINTGRNLDQVKKADAIVDHYHEIDIIKLLT